MEESKQESNRRPDWLGVDEEEEAHPQQSKHRLFDHHKAVSSIPKFYQENQAIKNADKLRPLEKLLRNKKTALVAGAIFLLAAGAAVFLILGVIACPTIALWLAPLSPLIMHALNLTTVAVASIALSVTAISLYHVICETKTRPDPAKIISDLESQTDEEVDRTTERKSLTI
ncbi:MAG: hypothetical protein P1U74_08960 [Legionellaceae bacterium]|nr:hypothetical protein [Legionellaceae bacterium]